MLIHISPRFYNPYSDVNAEIHGVDIPEFNLSLKGGVDIVTRKPFPNKTMQIVCRKIGRKAINGLFLETNEIVENFTLIAKWMVNNNLCTHQVHMHIVDKDFDAATDCLMLWNGFFNTPFDSRHHEYSKEWIPATEQPRMLVDLYHQKRVRDDQIYNYLHQNGIIKKRVEFYILPTVERERLLTKSFTSMTDRLPDVTHAIKVVSQKKSDTLLVKHGKLGVYTSRIDDWMEDLCFDFSEYQVSFGLDFVKLVKSIVKETFVHDQFFFANTNDFVNKVRIHSKSYNNVDDGTKEIINDILSQPLFRIFDAKKIEF